MVQVRTVIRFTRSGYLVDPSSLRDGIRYQHPVQYTANLPPLRVLLLKKFAGTCSTQPKVCGEGRHRAERGTHVVQAVSEAGLARREHVARHEAQRLAVHGEALRARAAPRRPRAHLAATPQPRICGEGTYE